MFGFLLKQIWKYFFHQEYNINIIFVIWGIIFLGQYRPKMTNVNLLYTNNSLYKDYRKDLHVFFQNLYMVIIYIFFVSTLTLLCYYQ
jgi:hypothetical protein